MKKVISDYSSGDDTDSETDSDYSETDNNEEKTEGIVNKILDNLPIFIINQGKRPYEDNSENAHQHSHHIPKKPKMNKKNETLLKEIRDLSFKNNKSMIERILESKLPFDAKKALINEIEEKESSSSEKAKMNSYIEKVLKIPFGVYKDIIPPQQDVPKFLTKLRMKLDDAISGHSETKSEIIDYIASILRNPSAKANILALQSPPGCGKCLATDTLVMMADGTTKKVQNIQVGEMLMGDDSTPRLVKALGEGTDTMYRITHTVSRRHYTVNSEHILCLLNNNGEIVEIPVKKYVESNLSYLGYTNPIDFKKDNKYFESAFDLGKFFGQSIINKVPKFIKLNSYEIRLKWLEGLIFACGTFVNDTTLEFMIDREVNTKELYFLIDSLGLLRTNDTCSKYTRVVIKIPNKNIFKTFVPTRCEEIIKVENVGVGKYYGFELDKNERFVLGNCIVTHNTKFVRALGEALDLPFFQLSFGGMNDVSILNGHDYTYIGSKPGKIYDILVKAKTMNSVVLLDECFPFYQKVVTDKGPMDIGVLYQKFKKGQELPMIKSFNQETKKFEYKKITHAWEKYSEDLLELNIGGFTTRCTENHPFLTEKGYIKAKNLTLDNNIMSQPSRFSSKKLNDDQYQIVIGSFLGDGHVYQLKSGKVGLKVRHGYKQHEYCEWKAQMFGVGTKIVEKNGFSQTKAIEFDSKIIHMDKKFPKVKTSCPQWLINDLNWKGIAIWLMDDGSIKQTEGYGNCKISTDSFDLDTNIRLVEKLNSLGVECKYYKYKEKYYSICITSKGYKKLIINILPYIHQSMSYKISPSLNKMIKLDKDIFWSFSEVSNPCVGKIYDIYSTQSGKVLRYKYDYCKKCEKNTYKTKLKDTNWFSCVHAIRKEDDFFLVKSNLIPYIWDNTTYDYELINLKSKKIVKNIGSNYNKKYLKSHDNKVYDIEIEDNHNFLITTGKSKYTENNTGIVVHNCDKLGALDSSKANEIYGALTHILDKEQNSEFYDHYLGSKVPLDLSKILFIASFNNEYNVDPIVLNRMKVIKIKESTFKEKIEIVKKFTIPEVIKNLKLHEYNIHIPDKIIKYIIMNKTVFEPGMRNINKNINTLISKINTQLFLEKASKEEQQKITKDLVYENVVLMRDADNNVVVTIELVDKFVPKRTNASELSMYN